MKKRLLLNYVYWMPVGHAIEAIKYARGFYEANKDIEIFIALNSSTPIEIVRNIPWIKRVYSIDLNYIPKSLKKIPKNWDYIINNHRWGNLSSRGYEGKMKDYYNLFRDEVSSRRGIVLTRPLESGNILQGLNYKTQTKIKLEIPKKNIKYGSKLVDKSKTKISIMLAGSAKAGEYPSVESWITILKKINEKVPNVEFYITGVDKRIGGRTSTEAFSREERGNLFGEIKNAKDCYNIGLWNQIALLKKSDLFISPHTGFAFLAPSVGTPWLAISGGDWPEYLFNRVPFYSVLPKTKEYPFYASKINIKKLSDAQARKVTQMDENGIKRRLPEIIKGVKKLLNKKFTFNESVKQHKRNIDRQGINKKALFFFESTRGYDYLKELGL